MSDAEFIVLDVSTSYNLLLGHPWYHPLRVVSSTAHQMVKTPFQRKSKTIHATRAAKDVFLTDVNVLPTVQGSRLLPSWLKNT